MKKTIILLIAMLFTASLAFGATLYLTTSGGSYYTEKWVDITTAVDGGGTVIWAQGDGTYGNGAGLVTDAAFTVTEGTTYYINCYDAYDDGWDGTTYEIRSATGGGGTLVCNNGGLSPSDGNDEDGSYTWEDMDLERESSESFSYTAPSCSAPSAQTETSITTSGAALGWTDASGSHWDIYVVAAGSAAPVQGTAPTANDVTTNPYTYAGGSAATTYDWYVRSDCDEDNVGTSTWTGASTFTTACEAYTPDYTEDFTTFLQTCWDEADSGDETTGPSGIGAGPWTGPSTAIGTGSARINLYTTTRSDWLLSPEFDLSAGGYQVVVDVAVTNWNSSASDVMGSDDAVKLVYTEDGSNWNNVIKTWTVSDALPNTPTTFTFALTSTGTNVQFGILATDGPTADSEDYDFHVDNFVVEVAPACPAPSAQTESNITSSGANLGWTDTSGSHWDIYVVAAGSAAPVQGTTPTANDVTANPYTYAGGSAVTTYDWYVRSDCDEDNVGTSTWTGASTFSTLQAPSTVQNFTFTEDWELQVLYPNWNNYAGAVSTIEINTTSQNGGTYGLEQYGNSGTSYITPSDLADAYTKAIPGGSNEDWTTWNKVTIDLSSAVSPRLTFYYAMGYEFNNNYNNFWVQIDAGSGWVDLFSTQTSGSAISYTEQIIDFPSYAGGVVDIRFFHNGKYNTNYLHLDDISIIEGPTCMPPSDLTATDLGIRSAVLGWTENNTPAATSWDIEFGDAGFTPIGTPTNTGVTNTYHLTGLTILHDYDYYVRTNCGGGDYSTWAGPYPFSTVNGKAVNPDPENNAVNVEVSATTLDWDDVIGADSYTIDIGTNSGFSDIVNDGVCATSTYTFGADWDELTEYYWRITTVYTARADIMGDEWKFTTLCDPITATFSENFDSATTPDLPDCWSKLEISSSTYPYVETSTTNSYSAPNNLRMYNYYTSDTLLLITPQLSDLTSQLNQIRFMGRASSSEDLIVGTMSDLTDETTFTPFQTINLSVNSYTQYIVRFDASYNLTDKYVALKHGATGTYRSIYIDDFIYEPIPSTPVFKIDPDIKDFGTVTVGQSSTNQTFTISNIGIGTLTINDISITGTDLSDFALTNLNPDPVGVGANTITVDVAFIPTSAGAKTAILRVIDTETARLTHDIPLSGTGFVPPQGSVCSDPITLTLPAIDVPGDTNGFFDDYNSTDISPSSSYLNGDDVVYQFTTTEEAILSGTIVTTGTWIGAFILIDCPNSTTPPTPVIQKTSSGNTLTYDDLLPAGTYFLIISSYPSPQSIDYNINLNVAPPDAPANVIISVDTAGLVTVGWDAVTGADSYIVYGCDTPDGTFIDISADGSFTGESWTSTEALGNKKFIQISTVRISRGSIIREKLTPEEREKMESNNDMSNEKRH